MRLHCVAASVVIALRTAARPLQIDRIYPSNNNLFLRFPLQALGAPMNGKWIS
jgi:hypothetical protein